MYTVRNVGIFPFFDNHLFLVINSAHIAIFQVVCVDEATANVDLETDKLVQDVLRQALHDCTVITIAHRVETVMGSDRVILFSNFSCMFGNPKIFSQFEFYLF